MMDGRVKTLHPAIHAGILARRHRPDDLAAIGTHGIQPIDIVVVNLYPFAAGGGESGDAFDGLVEEIDIGGPSLLRAAAKNFRDVLVVVDPAGLPAGARRAWAARPARRWTFRFELMQKAFRAHRPVRRDDCDDDGARDGDAGRHGAHSRPAAGGGPGRQAPRSPLRRESAPEAPPGRCPRPGPGGRGRSTRARSCRTRTCSTSTPRCGSRWSSPSRRRWSSSTPIRAASPPARRWLTAYVRAREADPLSAFGGIVGLNRPIDAETARALTATFIEAVVAPSIDEEARAVLAVKQNLRVVTADFDAAAGQPGDGTGTRTCGPFSAAS